MVKPSVDRQALARCPQSPKKSHHWMIPMIGLHPVGRCKYCGEAREFENNKSPQWDYGERYKQTYRIELGSSKEAQATEQMQTYYPEKRSTRGR